MLIENHFSYPIMLDLHQKRCVIIGGGTVAARKLQTLLQAGAQVVVVAPQFSEELLAAAQDSNVILEKNVYEKQQLQDIFLVIAATDSKEINRQITTDAPFLCNNITEPHLGNFSVPAHISQGDITLALATGGMPAFTRLLKQHLSTILTPDLDAFNTFLLEQRDIVKSIPSTPRARTAFWRQTLTINLLNLVLAGNLASAKEKIVDAISSFRTQSQNGSR